MYWRLNKVGYIYLYVSCLLVTWTDYFFRFMYRTMQTAVGVFGNEHKQPSMTSSPPILALEVARDRNVCLIYTWRNVLYIHHQLNKSMLINEISIFICACRESVLLTWEETLASIKLFSPPLISLRQRAFTLFIYK